MIICFSGTGNSRYCAEVIANIINDKIIDSNILIKNKNYNSLHSNKPLVFVSPTYAWQIPHILTEFINKTKFTGNNNAYFVMTCGSDIGNAGAKNQKLCEEKGFIYKGTKEIIMPENYIALFDAPNKKQTLQIIRHSMPAIKNTADIIRNNEIISDKNIKFSDKLKSGVVNKGFYKFYVKAKKFTVSDACVNCQKCVNSCPLNNISIKNNKPIWGDECTHCMACICGCPEAAIEYGKISIGKPRYQCPEYKNEID